jgi:hypothetical protein
MKMKKLTLIVATLFLAFAAATFAQYPISDDTTNPPTGAQRVFLMCFDGTTWDRCRGSDGVLFTRAGGPGTWSCSLDAIGATLTECRPAPGAGLKLYLTDLVIGSTTATAGQFLVRYGTGTNCGTGTTSLLPAAATVARYGYPLNTSAPATLRFATPLGAAANSAICIICVATNTCTVQMSGYTAP